MKKVIVIPHTHWDREWYFTEKEFKDRLVRVLDNVILNLEKYPKLKFQMDGQVAPIIDYLSRRPKNLGKIRKFALEKRLLFGPSFVLPDEFLSSPESLIRNLEYGMHKARLLGGYYDIAYYPDTFGHIGQLPQIIKQFGFGNVCIWRGVPFKNPEQRDLSWIGSDGTIVAAYHFDQTFNIGYGNCLAIKEEGNNFTVIQGSSAKALEEVISSELGKSSTETIVLMNGSDHRDLQEGIVEIVDKLNNKYPDTKFIFGSFEDYFEVVNKANNVSCIIRGELNKGTETKFLLNGTFSSRIRGVKQPYEKCNQKLLRAEFIQAIANKLTGMRYDNEALDEAWEYLLLNMPHDSLCGCSTDRVCKDMEYRFNQSDDISSKLIANSANEIASNVDTNFIKDESLAFVAINDSKFSKKIFKTAIDIPLGFGSFEIYDNNGNKADYSILSKKQNDNLVEKVAGGKGAISFPKNESIELIVKGFVPSLGFSSFEIRKAKQKKANANDDNFILENEHILVVVNYDGSFDVKDKKTGALYLKCNLLYDCGDKGDEYSFSPVDNDYVSLPEIGKIKAVFDNHIGKCVKVEYALKLPEKLLKGRKSRSYKKVKCKAVSYITLLDGAKKVDVVTEFDNKAKDHRLRAIFPTRLKSNCSYAAGHFEIVKREAKKDDIPLEGRMEVESNSYSHQGFFAMFDGTKGLGIVAKGLPEYEVKKLDSGTVCGELTLVRSVGYLSRDDLLARKGLAGPPVETPEAQELGNHKLEYSLVLLNNEDWVEELYKAKDESFYLCSSITHKHGGILKDDFSLIELPKGLQYSSFRIKGDKMLLRVYNPNSDIIMLDSIKSNIKGEVELSGWELESESISFGPKKVATFVL